MLNTGNFLLIKLFEAEIIEHEARFNTFEYTEIEMTLLKLRNQLKSITRPDNQGRFGNYKQVVKYKIFDQNYTRDDAGL